MTRSSSFRGLIRLAAALLAAAAGVLAFQGASASASGAQVLHLSAQGNMVLRFTTGRLHAHPGRITIVMHNPSNAGMDHGIAVQGHGVKKDGPVVSPGHNAVLTVVLNKKGRYAFYCPVEGHRQAGMSGVLTIS